MTARRAPAIALLAAGLAAGLACVPLVPARASAQDAGTASLLASPGSWPTTGAISSSTALGLDPSAVYLNPAGLATQDERTFLIHHGLLQFDTSWDLAAVAYPIPGLGAAGLGVARIGSSGIEAYDAANQPLGTIGYTETSLAASVARQVYGPVVAGVTFKVLSQTLGDLSAAAPSMDVGFTFRPAKLRGGQIGIAAQNVVSGSLDLGGPTEALDRTFRLGLASPTLRFGRFMGARGIADVERAGAEGTKSRLGVEVSRFGIGALRAGLDRGRPLLGFGVTWRRYGFDYAFAQGEIEGTQQIAVRLAWGEPVSQYEARRRAEFAKAAEDSVMARRAAGVARDRERADAAEARGDYEEALLLWEVLARERPNDATFAARAERARAEIADRAESDLEAESSKRLASTVAALTRAALARGDLEEAAGVWRGFVQPGRTPAGFSADTVSAVEAEFRVARDRAVALAVARADSLHRVGKVLDAAEAAAFALRLNPEDKAALEAWSSLELMVGKSAEVSASLTRKLEALTAVHAASVAFTEARYADAQTSIRRALALEPSNEEARAWRDRIERRLSTPKPEIDARVKQLYIKGMEAFSGGDYREALRNWEQILVLDPLNESARRNVLEARERMKAEAAR